MKKFRPGISFADFVVRDFKTHRFRGLNEDEGRDYRRGWLVWVGVVLAMGLLLMRLVELQLINGARYRVLADENRIKRVILTAERGKILDRHGDVLYPGESTAHVVGYLGEVGEEEVGILKEAGAKYVAGNLIGRSGIEAQYEEILRGIDGGKLVEVDNRGETVRELGQKLPVAGKDLMLTIDGGLQNIAYEAVKSYKAAVVVSDPKNGEILALVSAPSFDPKRVSDFLLDRNLPIFNRAIGGMYPPGSPFKMITTAAALESGKVAPGYTYEDRGIIKVGDYSYTNWLFTKRGGVEGWVGFSKALTRSTDTFFYKVGELTGPNIVLEWAKKMGLSQKTGIDLPGEVSGWLPERKDWFLGNTYHLAIGQDDILTTPLQINLMTSILATKGQKCKPHLNKRLSAKCEVVKISDQTLEIIKKGMIGACSDGGTAYPLFSFRPQVACKTGTAEYVSESGKMKTHAWLTAYVPVENSEYSITVLVEGGGEGSDVAAPVVRKIVDYLYSVE